MLILPQTSDGLGCPVYEAPQGASLFALSSIILKTQTKVNSLWLINHDLQGIVSFSLLLPISRGRQAGRYATKTGRHDVGDIYPVKILECPVLGLFSGSLIHNIRIVLLLDNLMLSVCAPTYYHRPFVLARNIPQRGIAFALVSRFNQWRGFLEYYMLICKIKPCLWIKVSLNLLKRIPYFNLGIPQIATAKNWRFEKLLKQPRPGDRLACILKGP